MKQKNIIFILTTTLLMLGILFFTKSNLEAKILPQPLPVWSQEIGGEKSGYFNDIQSTTDGGYIVVGSQEESITGQTEALITKFDALGNTLWSQIFVGEGIDSFTAVWPTKDGGYVAVGGNTDGLIVKFDANGTKIWDQAFAGTDDNYFKSVQQTTDGGFIVAGGGISGLLVKFDLNGNKEWDQLFADETVKYFNAAIQTADGGYIAVGGDTEGLLVKFDIKGNQEWDKEYTSKDSGYKDIKQTKDGGFIVLGNKQLVKLDNQGILLWEKITEGSKSETFESLSITSDEGYVIVGSKESKANGLKDGIVIKYDNKGNREWEQVYGGKLSNELLSVIQSSDEGYVAVGSTESSTIAGATNGFLVKFHKFGISPIPVGVNNISGVGNPGEKLKVKLPDTSETEVVVTADGNWMMNLLTTTKGGDEFIVTSQSGLVASELVVSDLSGIFTIRNKNSGLIMDVYNRGIEKGNNIIQWSGTDGINQKWKFEKLENGFYRITSLLSGLSLDLYNAGENQGNYLIQWPYHGGTNQQWQIIENADGTITFKSRLNLENGGNFVLDIYNANSNPGDNVIQWPLNDGDSQKWYMDDAAQNPGKDFTGTYNILSKNSRLVMDVYNGGIVSGNNIIQWFGHGGINQQWNFEKLENGYYKITSVSSGMSLDVYNGGYDQGNRVIQWPYHGGANQQWRVIDHSDGSISLRSKMSEDNYTFFVLDVFNGGTTAGLNVIQWATHYRENQRWILDESFKTVVPPLKILDVPIIAQRPELPTGCEITATTMLFNYAGVNVNKVTLAYEMPKHPTNPNLGFVGSPFLSSGWTINPPALMNLYKKYLGTAVNLTGSDMRTIEYYVSRNKPVVVWVSSFYGFSVHAITVTGYDSNYIFYNDPWSGVKNARIPRSIFLSRWQGQSFKAMSF